MEQVSENDINEVTKNARLQQSDLENLFIGLGMEANEIENAKKNSGTTDIKLQAASVLRSWRKSRGKDATRQAVITALETCGYTEAVQRLQEKWKMTSSTKGSSDSSGSQSLVIDFHATFA